MREEILRVNGTPLVDWVTNDVDDSAEGLLAHGDLDGRSSVDDWLSTDKTLGTVHGNGTDGVLSQVLGNCVKNRGKTLKSVK